MSTAQKRQRRTAGNKLRSLLPKSAQSVVWEGKKFVALPDGDIDGWLEDLVDGIEATVAMREAADRMSQSDVKKRYDME